MGLGVEFSVLVFNADTNIYEPIWYNHESREYAIYDAPNLSPTESQLFDIAEFCNNFTLLYEDKPYPLSYYLAGVGHPYLPMNMERYKGLGMSGVPRNTHLHFRVTLNPKENNCVSLDLFGLLEDGFNVSYHYNKLLRDYPPTIDLITLLQEIKLLFPVPTSMLLVVKLT